MSLLIPKEASQKRRSLTISCFPAEEGGWLCGWGPSQVLPFCAHTWIQAVVSVKGNCMVPRAPLSCLQRPQSPSFPPQSSPSQPLQPQH